MNRVIMNFILFLEKDTYYMYIYIYIYIYICICLYAYIHICLLKKYISSKHGGNFCCLNGLHSFRMKEELELHKKVCENNPSK